MTTMRAHSRWWWGMAVVLLLSAGCATGGTKLCEGGSSTFDCAAFATLATAHDTIEAAKVQFPHEQGIINPAVAAFNLASDAYVAYHSAVSTNSAADGSELSERLATLEHELANLLLLMRRGATRNEP